MTRHHSFFDDICVRNELVLLDHMCDELYCRKLVLLIMKHIVFACHKPEYFLPILEAPRLRR
jgi:hypothetical protein